MPQDTLLGRSARDSALPFPTFSPSLGVMLSAAILGPVACPLRTLASPWCSPNRRYPGPAVFIFLFFCFFAALPGCTQTPANDTIDRVPGAWDG
jgi:hypothetical protein